MTSPNKTKTPSVPVIPTGGPVVGHLPGAVFLDQRPIAANIPFLQALYTKSDLSWPQDSLPMVPGAQRCPVLGSRHPFSSLRFSQAI